ncbi:MAG: DUF4270 domain-containing protein [Flavobacteriaceae bacterium]|nr:DUF4270 domain-containing protein [Flavobacteriaceae bacterium]MBL6680678.1 DUF4270 domain-containing protein [Flavobacteriaceae bacterium]
MKSKFLILLLITLFSCTKEYNTIGTDILKSDTFKTNVELVPINVVQKAIPPFKSNALPAYQLGSINDNLFGKSEASFITQVNLSENSPNFGLWSQQRENDGDDSNIAVIEENETVTNVYLDIPFFNNTFDSDGDGVIDIYDVDNNDINSDSDGDGLTDIQERANGTDPLNPDTDGDGITDDKDTDTQNPNSGATLYDVDSLLGNRDASFKIKVQELDYYLRSYDPTNNFESFQKYYSDEIQLLNFSGFTIHDDEVSIDTNEIVIYKEDDPDTDDVDESEEVKERLTPRLRLPLDKDFFQRKIIDHEGSDDMTNADNFNIYFKGLVLQAYDFSEDLLMILDYSNAKINIEYEYDKYNKNDTDDNTSDDTIDKVKANYELNLSGNQINVFNKSAYNQDILNNLNSSENLSRVFLKGGEGLIAEIDLFTDNDGNNVLDEIRANGWLVNEANLTMYVDKDKINESGNLIEPFRVYLYDIDAKTPLPDYYIDNSTGPKKSNVKIVHSGILELDEDDKGLKYKIRISEHVKNIVRNDSISAKLGLAVSSSISNSVNTDVKTTDVMKYIPLATAINPLGTVLIGPNPEPENFDKRMRLEIYYTEINN